MFVALVLVGILTIYFLFFRTTTKSKLLSKIPGPTPLPIFGNALSVNVPNEEILKVILGWKKKFGNRFKTQLGPFNHYVLIFQAEDAEKVLSSNTHIDKSAEYSMLMPWLGTGLLTSTGKKWFHRRKLLTPAFHFKILDDFLIVFNEQSKIFVNILHKELNDERVFNMYPYITRCTLDIICETAMGKKISAQLNRDSDYVKATHRLSEIIQQRHVRPWLHPNFIWKISSLGREESRLLEIVHGFTEKVIKEKKAERSVAVETILSKDENTKEENDVFMQGKPRVAFLDLLLNVQAEGENGRSLSDLDIREETDTFMFEGHDTTAANINWTIFLLGCNKDCQLKVQEELDSIFGNDKDRPISTADLCQMKYLECCIKESLRIYPSVPFLGRELKSELQLDDQTTVPTGTTMFLIPYELHRDPNVYPEPERFNPERFFPENSVGRSPYAYIPFSAGPRNCIGQRFALMEEKVILANLFRNFNVEAVEKREDIILLAELVMRPKHGIKIKLNARH